VGLLQYCCGVPAHWSGREEMRAEACAEIERLWERSGKPEMLLACTTCMDVFARFLPAIRVRSLWEVLAENPVAKPKTRQGGASVFDPCTGSKYPAVRASVRKILRDLGVGVHELADGERAACCGYGGSVYLTNAALYHRIAEKNAAASPFDCVTYCVNCADSFAVAGKPALHILDLLLFDDANRGARKPPALSDRRGNRLLAKNRILNEFGNRNIDAAVGVYPEMRVEISKELLSKMERNLILVENVKHCIANAEKTGSKLYRKSDDCFVAHLRQGVVTYWTEYKKRDDAFVLVSVYSHRMAIEEPAR
jgi:hypothetical protein